MKKRRTILFAAVSVTLIVTAAFFVVHNWKLYKRHCELIELFDSLSLERKQFLEERQKELESFLNDSILPRLENGELTEPMGTIMLPYNPLLRTLNMPQPR